LKFRKKHVNPSADIAFLRQFLYVCIRKKYPIMYKQLLRPILFRFNAETAHNLTLSALDIIKHIPFAGHIVRMLFKKETPGLEREVFGIKFPNPVGLAGGLDKNGEHYNDLSNFGFGFVEIGSLTPEPQEGNPKPRLFRIVNDKAIINRMGINNKGVRNAVRHLQKEHPEVIVAGNISKNATSMNEDSARDYEKAFALLYDFVDMFVINISCPNVAGLSDLQDVSFLSDIVDRLLDLRMYYDEYRPILIKVSPDIPRPQLDEMLEYCMMSGIDGIVAGNTTRSRDGLSIPADKIEEIGAGGMSGAPLYRKNLELVKYIHGKVQDTLAIVGSGGIMSPEQAQEMLDAGASLIEVYSGFIYEGPGFVKKILRHLEDNLSKTGSNGNKLSS